MHYIGPSDLIVKIPVVQERREGSDGARGGRGQGMGEGGGRGAQPCKKHQLIIIIMKKYCSAVHGVRLDLEET